MLWFLLSTISLLHTFAGFLALRWTAAGTRLALKLVNNRINIWRSGDKFSLLSPFNILFWEKKTTYFDVCSWACCVGSKSREWACRRAWRTNNILSLDGTGGIDATELVISHANEIDDLSTNSPEFPRTARLRCIREWTSRQWAPIFCLVRRRPGAFRWVDGPFSEPNVAQTSSVSLLLKKNEIEIVDGLIQMWQFHQIYRDKIHDSGRGLDGLRTWPAATRIGNCRSSRPSRKPVPVPTVMLSWSM